MGRNVWMIGGSQGIGASLWPKLLEDGWNVYLTSRTASKDLPSEVTYHQADILEGEIPDDFLPDELHGFVYQPGSITLKPFRGLKEADFRNDLEINLLGAVRSLQWVERKLKAADKASVVLFSTVAVQRGMPFHASVSSAKGAVEGLVRSLAAEWAPGIRVNAIAPSLTNTPMAGKLLNTESKVQSAKDRHPLKKIGDPGEIAEFVRMLLDHRSSFMTGQVIGVDGGLSVI